MFVHGHKVLDKIDSVLAPSQVRELLVPVDGDIHQEIHQSRLVVGNDVKQCLIMLD